MKEKNKIIQQEKLKSTNLFNLAINSNNEGKHKLCFHNFFHKNYFTIINKKIIFSFILIFILYLYIYN